MASISSVIEGMRILAKYLPYGAAEDLGGAKHDVIYVLPPETEVSDEDVAKLTNLGWHLDEEMGWSRFV